MPLLNPLDKKIISPDRWAPVSFSCLVPGRGPRRRGENSVVHRAQGGGELVGPGGGERADVVARSLRGRSQARGGGAASQRGEYVRFFLCAVICYVCFAFIYPPPPRHFSKLKSKRWTLCGCPRKGNSPTVLKKILVGINPTNHFSCGCRGRLFRSIVKKIFAVDRCGS